TSLQGRIPASQEVVADAIQIEGVTYSALVHDWIEGPTLAAAVGRARKAGNGGVLRALAKAVLDLANSLRAAGFAHQNLNADNLIISPTGSLMAVGLDAAKWPQSPPGATPHRTPPFLHPKGAANPFEQDAFATLLIYATLRAMADDPALAATYGDPIGTPGGALLFSTWDLADPSRSRAFGEIAANVRSDTRELIDALRRACTAPSAEVERWAQAIPGIVALPASVQAREEPTAVLPAAPANESWDVSDAIERIKARFQGEEEEAPRAPAADPAPSSWNSWGVPVQPQTPPNPPPPPAARETRARAQSPQVAPSGWETRREPIAAPRVARVPPPSVAPEPADDGWTTVAPAAIVNGQIVTAEPEPATPAPERRPRRRVRTVEVPAETWEGIVPEPVLMTPVSLIEDRRALRAALTRRDAAVAFQLWERLADDPVGRTFALEVERLRSVQIRTRIREEAGRKDDREVIRLAESARIDGSVLDADTRMIVRSARDRAEVGDRLERALAGSDRDRLADLAVTGDLMA
ncbi:MAG TPA: hypothetical protein VFQ54_04250, partial [Thermomicrobiales bacterium]|nr:hypothetical protein [Thermomicrobiales bacterium]